MTNESIGRVVTAADPDYDEARKGWNECYQSNPREIVFCSDAGEVAAALRRCREQQLLFRVRSGGHSLEGYSSLDDGVVIDLSEMNSLSLNADGTEVVLGAGARLGDVYRMLFESGVTVPGGTCPRVAVGGLALGGGMGYLSRTCGLLTQSVVAMEVVDATGTILTVDKDNHPDLFWACRGGGGGIFGIATSFTLRTTPVSDVGISKITWSWDHFAEVFDAYQRWLPTSDSRVNTMLALPAQHYGIVAMSALSMTTQEELESLLQPLLDIVPAPQEAQFSTVPYVDAVSHESDLLDPQVYTGIRFGAVQPYFDGPLDPGGIALLRRLHAEARGNTMTFVLGAASEVFTRLAEGDPVAYPHLDALMSFDVRIDWTDASEDQGYFEWLAEFERDMRPYTSGTYLNYNDFNIDGRLYPRYRESFARLVEVKHHYDPENVFSFPASIPPSLTADDAQRMELPASAISALRASGRLTE
ncbi:FAD-binding oxidoreductase [Mycolicibacterium sp. CBMA 226]|uniref:FAD-binding oxidoreductase n=1 Tax=Mycolicibacterium sp. CBMA 226 TaxID=2606611 RepID=UPI0012DF84B5|nr:FAD-binding oxidoreductase [Mycolicibacterium sp. CBMA 226]MUL78678.1 FAD-binding oxidoreductase [Mycolicibacterium sp. CBMA 226]